MSASRHTEESTSGLRTLEPQPPPRRRLASRFGILHLIALMSGLLAFMMIVSWMRAQENVVEVVVAIDVVRSGNVITADMFETVEIPAAASFGERLLTPQQLERRTGSIATRTIDPGQPVLGTDLRAVETPTGLRAMAVPVDINRAVGGEIAVGDRVDVIGFDEAGAHYVATDVEVLGVPGARSATFGATSSFAVTLAVDDHQALAIAQGLDFGTVHLLRSTGAPEVTTDRLLVDDGALDDPAVADPTTGVAPAAPDDETVGDG